MKRLLDSKFVDHALRGASLVVTDRRWAAPLSAAALGFGIFAGVAIGPGTAGSLATGAQQIIELPSSGGGEGQSGGGGAEVASTEGSALPEGGEVSGFEESLPSTVPLAAEPIEPLPAAPAAKPAAKSAPGGEEEKEPEGQSFEGTVVHTNDAAGSYAIAIEGGELVSVHAAKLPEPGTMLSASLRRLANATFAEAEDIEAEKKKATEATIRGIVTFADPDPATPAYTLSSFGSSLLVHVNPDPSGAPPQLPAIGSSVTTTATIEKPVEPDGDSTLVQSELEVDSISPSTYLELAGIVEEVLPDTGQLLLSADDSGESEAVVTLAVPTGIDAKKLEVGDSYLATATVEPDGSLMLSGIVSDEHAKGAGETGSAQGDLKR